MAIGHPGSRGPATEILLGLMRATEQYDVKLNNAVWKMRQKIASVPVRQKEEDELHNYNNLPCSYKDF